MWSCSDILSYWKASWASIDWKCPTLFSENAICVRHNRCISKGLRTILRLNSHNTWKCSLGHPQFSDVQSTTETEFDPQNRSSFLETCVPNWIPVCSTPLLGEPNCESVSRTWFLWKKVSLPYKVLNHSCNSIQKQYTLWNLQTGSTLTSVWNQGVWGNSMGDLKRRIWLRTWLITHKSDHINTFLLGSIKCWSQQFFPNKSNKGVLQKSNTFPI